jgi:hypothetical protein
MFYALGDTHLREVLNHEFHETTQGQAVIGNHTFGRD